MTVTYLNLLVYLNFIIVSFAVVIRWLTMRSETTSRNAGQIAMLIWLCHSWMFFAVGVMLRLLGLYTHPTLLMSAWGSAVYIHATGALAMDGYYHLKRSRYCKRRVPPPAIESPIS